MTKGNIIGKEEGERGNRGGGSREKGHYRRQPRVAVKQTVKI